MAQLKRKRVSKKNKSSWRKNVNIEDVENFLEDKRLEERLGRNLDTAKSADLFDIDTGGDDDNTLATSVVAAPKVNIKKSLRLKETEIPKCYAILTRRSAVPDPVVQRNPIKQKPKVLKNSTYVKQVSYQM